LKPLLPEAPVAAADLVPAELAQDSSLAEGILSSLAATGPDPPSPAKVNVPAKQGDHIGPVVSETQFNKIQTLIKKGIDEGAKLVAGGVGKPDGLEKGYFVKPTVFADVNNQMEIARTEIFGPVLSIMPFETEEEAISIANDTPYGLTNYIQTQDQKKANRVARKLRSGMVDVNGAGIAVDAPFGGYKHSGIGREAGAHGLEEFLEVKTVGGWKDN